MPEPHYLANGAMGSPVGTTCRRPLLPPYRELLDDEDHAFDELEHAYEDGDRAHFELDLAAWRSAFERRVTFLETSRHRDRTARGLAVSARLRERGTSTVAATTRSVRPTKKWLAPGDDLGRALRPARDLALARRRARGTRRAARAPGASGAGRAPRPSNARPKRSGGAMPDPPVDARVVDRQRHVGAERPADERERHRRRRAAAAASSAARDVVRLVSPPPCAPALPSTPRKLKRRQP